jgi:branched-chain amino acid transport system substrate-binding protein
MMNALADMVVAQGVKTAAVVHVDDLFGLENVDALGKALASHGIQLVEKKGYPLGVKDLSPVLKALKEKNPDAFLGITYPPDTILVSKQAKEIGFNPKIFYAAVGTAFPLYKAQLAADTEGVMGMGSWNAKTSAAAKDYFAAHVAKFQKEPDRWASAHAYASLQILQQAVERVGLDRAKIREAIAGGEFETILGPIKFKDGMNASIPGTVSQWQKGEFEVVWPKARATAQLVAPKPAWH